jgi:hypothetical protein
MNHPRLPMPSMRFNTAVTVKDSDQCGVAWFRIKSGTRTEKLTKTTTIAQDHLTKSNAKLLYSIFC